MHPQNSFSSNSNAIVDPTENVSMISATILYQLSPKNNNLLIISPRIINNSSKVLMDPDDSNSPKLENSYPAEVANENIHTDQQISPNIHSSILSKHINISVKEPIQLNPKKRLLQRHILEIGPDDNTYRSDNESESTSRHSANEAPFGRGKNGKPLTRTPFIPSYMDPKSGPFLCKVCGYKASGLHYRVMACEGCKGFFRRSVQKKLNYVCKMNNNCKISSDNRAKCQQCRWVLCINAGMEMAAVLNEHERRIKNNLIKVNREKRNQALSRSDRVSDSVNTSLRPIEPAESREKQRHVHEIIDRVTEAFETAFVKDQGTNDSVPIIHGLHVGQDSIDRVAVFARLLPGMDKLSEANRCTILRARCLDIICLYTALTYDPSTQHLKLPNGRIIGSSFIEKHVHLEPLWNFARRTAEHCLSRSEMAILTGLAFLINNTAESFEPLHNQLLEALNLLGTGQPLRNSKLLIVIFSDLQVLTNRLFELRAPLGQQLLFDIGDGCTMADHSTSQNPPQQISFRLLNQVNINSESLEDRHKTTALPVATGTSSSIFAFSYGDRQL